MARSTPVNSGYSIISGTGTGTNGSLIDVWVEYKVISQSAEDKTTNFRAYFYAALKQDKTASTALDYGLASSFKVDNVAGPSWENIGYDFTKPGVPCVVSADIDDEGVKKNYLGRFVGNIVHDQDGGKSVTITGSFTTQSASISGGNISATIDLPNVYQGCLDIDTGSGIVKVVPYIDNSQEFAQALTFIDNVSDFNMCG